MSAVDSVYCSQSVLDCLAAAGEPMRAKDIVKMTGREMPAVSQALARLDAQGLVNWCCDRAGPSGWVVTP
jgi:DNA-binding IclR family transcriptional regulator